MIGPVGGEEGRMRLARKREVFLGKSWTVSGSEVEGISL